MLETVYYQSPQGWIEIMGSEDGLAAVRYIENEPDSLPATPKILAACVQQLDEYFKGQRQEFDLKLNWSKAKPFEKSVWTALLDIPYGEVRTYADIAQTIGNPDAVRAVGTANGNNPIAIIVPCHRVVGRDNKLRGYAYGIHRKSALLELENAQRSTHNGQLRLMF